MVKQLYKLVLFSLIIIFSVTACNNDLFGLFTSTDLDHRLESKNIIKMVNPNGSLSVGNDYSFIVLTDTHIEDGNMFNLEKLTDLINDTSNNIKFIVFIGDITQYGAEHDVKNFIELAATFGSVPCYPVIGNHDIFFGNWNVWKDYIGSTSYKIKGDGITLFIIDTANAFIGKKQLDWLENELRTVNKDERVFVFSHASLFINSPGDMKHVVDIKERARIISILRNKCDIMFMGHLHKSVYNEVGNVKYVSLEDYVMTRSYCLVTVSPSGVTYSIKKL